jgi:hypothetical protein
VESTFPVASTLWCCSEFTQMEATLNVDSIQDF